MKKNWKDGNMLLKEERPGKYRYQGHDYEDFYYSVIFSYSTEEERDEAFEYFDENSSYNMTNIKKEGKNKIKLIKYISNQLDPSDFEINEDIESWVNEQAEKTGAYSTEIEESSYEAYHDMFFEKMKKRNLREERQSDDEFSVNDLMDLFEEIKESIGADDLCYELSFYITENMGNKGLKEALDYISEKCLTYL